jgi:hypothetical protein
MEMAKDNTNKGSESAPVSAPMPPQASEPVALNLRAAYEQTLPMAQALAVADLLPVNVDLPTAVNTAVGKMPQILALRERVKDELPKFDLSHFDQLEQYALAAGHSHTRFLTASTPPQALTDLNTQGQALRDILYKDAVALAARGLIPGDRIGDFKSSVGYKSLTYDLLGLADILRTNWARISAGTSVRPSDLDRAEALGGQLVSAVSAREQLPVVTADAALQRQRNFTVFANAYDQVRRAISYLRWNEDDLESVAPSLYGGRTVNRKKPGDQPGAPPSPGTTGNASTSAAHPAGATPAASSAPNAPANGHATAPVAAVAPGLPGASPFAGG